MPSLALLAAVLVPLCIILLLVALLSVMAANGATQQHLRQQIVHTQATLRWLQQHPPTSIPGPSGAPGPSGLPGPAGAPGSSGAPGRNAPLITLRALPTLTPPVATLCHLPPGLCRRG